MNSSGAPINNFMLKGGASNEIKQASISTKYLQHQFLLNRYWIYDEHRCQLISNFLNVSQEL